MDHFWHNNIFWDNGFNWSRSHNRLVNGEVKMIRFYNDRKKFYLNGYALPPLFYINYKNFKLIIGFCGWYLMIGK